MQKQIWNWTQKKTHKFQFPNRFFDRFRLFLLLIRSKFGFDRIATTVLRRELCAACISVRWPRFIRKFNRIHHQFFFLVLLLFFIRSAKSKNVRQKCKAQKQWNEKWKEKWCACGTCRNEQDENYSFDALDSTAPNQSVIQLKCSNSGRNFQSRQWPSKRSTENKITKSENKNSFS